jgi:hypothetical protein
MLAACPAIAQRGPPPGGGINAAAAPGADITGYMSSADVKGLADFVDTTRRLDRKDLVSKAEALKRSIVMLDALHIACSPTDAEHVASGQSGSAGRPASVGLYEVACGNGMGYLLTLVGLSGASGISCLAASATETDTAVPSTVDTHCHLPANQDLHAMAATVMRGAGVDCDARDAGWLGQGGTPALDYTEVGCADGRDFVLRTPAPGSTAAIDVLSCGDAARHGAACKLTAALAPSAAPGLPDAAQTRPDLKWFKDQLAGNHVACDVRKARVIGRESVKRRYVVEYECPQQPRGLVAYVPAPGDTVNAFESMDCDAAAQRKLACQFVPAR